VAVIELWRTNYVKDAYEDQTGRKHWGHVVYEQVAVEDTGERFDVDDGYSKHPGLGKVYRQADPEGDRRFGLYPETVSYTGGTHVRLLFDRPTCGDGSPDRTYGYWIRAPRSAKGYCYPDGSGPVTPVLA
jgi:hypothetical protein